MDFKKAKKAGVEVLFIPCHVEIENIVAVW